MKVNKAVDFPGEAKVTLVGLPNRVTTEPATITKDSTEVVFHLKTDPATPAGRDEEPVLPGRGHPRRRADRAQPRHRPPPGRRPAAAEEGRAAAPAAKPTTAAAPDKPLSRLEKLRLESRERAKAAAERP